MSFAFIDLLQVQLLIVAQGKKKIKYLGSDNVFLIESFLSWTHHEEIEYAS